MRERSINLVEGYDMVTHALRLLVVAMMLVFGQAAGAEENNAQELFYSQGDGTKAIFGSDGGARQSPESGPGQEYTPENIGGLGGITNYYEKLRAYAIKRNPSLGSDD